MPQNNHSQHAQGQFSNQTTENATDARAVVQFWSDAGAKAWFEKNEQFDEEFRTRFLELHYSVARRERDAWMAQPEPCLALIILTDQFPRNCFRGTAHMYATDLLARFYARHFIEAGHIEHVEPELRVFGCLPFEHSEDPVDQDYSVLVHEKFAPDSANWAHHHREIIRRFGRFPHRNPMLARTTTPQEQQFLDEGGFTG